jgi:hypothetical protein
MRHVENWDLDPTCVIALAREGDQVLWRVEEVSRAYGGAAWVLRGNLTLKKDNTYEVALRVTMLILVWIA